MTIRNRVAARSLTVLVALAFAGALAVSVDAQPSPGPVRVVQAGDGTLYVIQGTNSWTLVPDQIGDSDAAALTPSGEIDGTFPNQLFLVQAPAEPPAAAPVPPAAQQPVAAPPTPVPTAPTAGPTPITGTVDLTGRAASGLPGTPIGVGATISSILDRNSKPQDVFSMDLSAGASYQFIYSSPNHYGTIPGGLCYGLVVTILNPDSSTALNSAQSDCNPMQSPPTVFVPAVSGTYYLQNAAQISSQRYKFIFKQS